MNLVQYPPLGDDRRNMTLQVLLLYLLAGALPPVDAGWEPAQGSRVTVSPRSGRASRSKLQAKAHPDPLVTWDTLVAERSLRLGERVRLQVQFHSWATSWNPYITRFGPGDFACLASWSDEQFPWIREHYDGPAVRLFVRRGSPAEKALLGSALYQRFEVLVDLREVLRDRPWGEIVAARPLERSLGEGTVIHAARAWTLLGNGTRVLAAEELRRSLAGKLPKPAREELQRLLALCREPEPADTADSRRGR